MLRTWIAALILAAGVLAFLFLFYRRERAPDPAAESPYSVAISGLIMDTAFAATQTPKPRIELWYPAEPAFPGRLSNAQARWPLLLYFAGWPGAEIQNRLLLRHLVSRGFMVAVVTYPEASTLPALDFGSAAGIERSLPLFDRRVREAASDATRVLDELGRLDALDDGWLSHRLDPAHSGILGFSWGGAVAVRTYWTDARLGSAVVLDEDRWLDAPQRPDSCRVLLLSDEPAANYEDTDLDGRKLLRQLRSYGGTWLMLPGAVHDDFTDAVLTPPLRRRLFSPISPRRKSSIVESSVSAWLEAGLRGSSAAAAPDPRRLFPEVKVTEFHGGTSCPVSR